MVLHSKRPFAADDSWEPICKHARKLEHDCGLLSGPVAAFKETPGHPHYLGQDQESTDNLGTMKFDGHFVKEFRENMEERKNQSSDTDGSTLNLSHIKDSGQGLCDSTTLISLAPQIEDATNKFSYIPDTDMRLLMSQHSFDAELYSRVDEFVAKQSEYLSRKLVPIGADHQAVIPPCTPSDSVCGMDDSDKFAGICIIPMPNDSETTKSKILDETATVCNCSDEGSIRCVRQHILEARASLREAFGEEKFAELGFCEMGEVVTSKWTEEDERLFQVVIFSNPPSTGRNFWEHLSVVLPSKSQQELVSYYFNVFVLRRRAEQNRLDPCNIDSDDEWQLDGYSDESGSTDDEDDSVDSAVDCLPDMEEIVCVGNFRHEQESFSNDHENLDGDADDFEDTQTGSLSKNPSTHGLEHDHTTKSQEEQDLHDDSCTSYDSENNERNMKMVPLRCVFADNRSCDTPSRGYISEQCDPRIWDVGFLGCSKHFIDLLPTCKVIKEVFGDEPQATNMHDNKRSN